MKLCLRCWAAAGVLAVGIAHADTIASERALWAIAAEAGLDSVRDESELRARHDADNEARRARLASGQPVYGPRQLAWPAFRRHWNASLRHALVALQLRDDAPDPAELQVFYTLHLERFTDARGEPLAFEQHRAHIARSFIEDRLDRRVADWIARAE